MDIDTSIIPAPSKKDYQLLVDEIKSAITEAVFASRWALIEGHWNVGKLIREYSDGEVTDLLHSLASDTGTSQRLLWYCLKCYDTYPKIDTLPEGKNISWNKLITKYLTESKSKDPIPEHACPVCGYIHNDKRK